MVAASTRESPRATTPGPRISRQRPDTFGQNLLGLTRRRRQESPIGPALVVDPGSRGAVLKLPEERARRSSRSLPGAEERDVASARVPSAHGARSHSARDASSWRARTEPGQKNFALTVSRRARRAQAGMTAYWFMVETRSSSPPTTAHPEQEPEAKPLRSERAQRASFGRANSSPSPAMASSAASGGTVALRVAASLARAVVGVADGACVRAA